MVNAVNVEEGIDLRHTNSDGDGGDHALDNGEMNRNRVSGNRLLIIWENTREETNERSQNY